MMEQYIYEGKLKYFYERCLFDQKPITADIFLTDFCNLKCSYCRYEKTNNYMEFDLFCDTVKRLQALGIKGFILTGGGEPMINPDIAKILAWLNKNGLSYGINSNGLKLPGDIRAKFLKIGIDYVDRRIYRDQKGRDGLGIVIKNLQEFRRRNRKTVLGVQAVIESADQVREFCNFFYEWDLDYISIRPIESQKWEYKNKMFEIRSELNRAENHEKINVSYKWKYIYPRFEGYEKCYGWWTILNISHDGSVNYCCNKPDEKVGSIFENNILHKLEKYKTDMSKCEIPCRKSGINDFIRDLKPITHVEFC
jgi:MoaA/NifB/PqqE/SkfB family radical SAM enzyme